VASNACPFEDEHDLDPESRRHCPYCRPAGVYVELDTLRSIEAALPPGQLHERVADLADEAWWDQQPLPLQERRP
jgi:hypothetical protein